MVGTELLSKQNRMQVILVAFVCVIFTLFVLGAFLSLNSGNYGGLVAGILGLVMTTVILFVLRLLFRTPR